MVRDACEYERSRLGYHEVLGENGIFQKALTSLRGLLIGRDFRRSAPEIEIFMENP
jgi:hypothetical protein